MKRTISSLFFKIAEPRVVRLVQCGLYLCLATAGGYILGNPPASFLFVLGEQLIGIFGVALLLGGLAGALAVLPGIWWLERMGVIALWTGLGLFAVIAISLGISIVGFLVSIALILSLVQRWFEIRKFQLAPRER